MTQGNAWAWTCFSMICTMSFLYVCFILWGFSMSWTIAPALGQLINPVVSIGSGNVFIPSMKQGPDREETVGLGEKGETILYSTSKFTAVCMTSFWSLEVSPLISWWMSEPVSWTWFLLVFFLLFPKRTCREHSFLTKQAEGTVSSIFF